MFDLKNGRTKRVSLLFASLTVLAAFAFVMIQANTKIFPQPISAAIIKSSYSPLQANEKLESELITVSRFGFMPLAITRPFKDFVMVIENRTADPELNLTLNRTVGNRPTDKVTDVKLKRGRGNWYAHLNLPPGEYELSEASHPEWKCKITLTPR